MRKINFKLNSKQLGSGLAGVFLLVICLFILATYHWQKIREELSLLSRLFSQQSAELVELNQQIELLQAVNAEGLLKLENQLLTEKEKRQVIEEQQQTAKVLTQQQILTLENKIAQNTEEALTEIIEQWKPFVVALGCSFYFPGTTNLILQSNGSGFLTELEDGTPAILTNKHIITAVSLGSNALADTCQFKFPQGNVSLVSEDLFVTEGDFDWGVITLTALSESLKVLASQSPSLCVSDPSLGDELVILGYPSIGDQKNVTVTEGIIAGFDENYFITSAKVEKGNSGGVAVSLKNNCYLGTPTFSRVGEIESLARILDVRVLTK